MKLTYFPYLNKEPAKVEQNGSVYTNRNTGASDTDRNNIVKSRKTAAFARYTISCDSAP